MGYAARGRGPNAYSIRALREVIQTLPFDKWYYAFQIKDKMLECLNTTWDGRKSKFKGNVSSTSVGKNMRLLVSRGVIEKRWCKKVKAYQYRRVEDGSDSDK